MPTPAASASNAYIDTSGLAACFGSTALPSWYQRQSILILVFVLVSS
jgi:hypothetical protein